jgi:hypothetical protein
MRFALLEKKPYSRFFCQIAAGNQGAATADRPLEPHGAPSITLNPSMHN